MLAEACGIEKIILICGYTDLRYGIDGLAQQIGTRYNINPFRKNVLFLFCGRRIDRIKGLVWEGNITSVKGIQLRINRSIQAEGVFGVTKQDYGFKRWMF